MRLLMTLVILTLLLGLATTAAFRGRAEQAQRLEAEAAHQRALAAYLEGEAGSQGVPIGIDGAALLADENALLKEQVRALQDQIIELRAQIETLKAARDESR